MTRKAKKVKQETHGTNEQKVQNRRQVKGKTLGQDLLVESINSNHITIAIGPAGCGKTYIAAGLAVHHLLDGKVKKIVITRPTVAADEDLGALPGGMDAKLYPFLIPLYDELSYFATPSELKSWVENGILEVAPIGYIRGRTFKNAFVILDESQNATQGQIKMFLTRYGQGSKFVINGDHTQTDLPAKFAGGLKRAAAALDGVQNLGIIQLEARDIVRDPLVSEIIGAFEKYGF